MTRSLRHGHAHGHKPLNIGRRSVISQPDTHAAPVNDFDIRSMMDSSPKSLIGRTPPPPPGSGGSSSGGSSASSSTPSNAASASSTCSSTDRDGACQRPTYSNNNTLPIVLGAVIPVLCAIGVFIYLHRRHLKKLKNEDAMDKHKSLDFGMDGAAPTTKGGKKGKKNKGMDVQTTDLAAEKEFRRGKGMSMDMGSPYLLPPEMQGSRESLHSLSRNMHMGDDKYRPATNFTTNDSASIRSFPSRRNFDNSSVYTGSSGGPIGNHDNMQHELIPNAQRMSKSSVPKRTASLSGKHPDNATLRNSPSPPIPMPEPAHVISRKEVPAASSGLVPPTQIEERDSYIEKDGGDVRRSNNYLGAFINREPSPLAAENPPPDHTAPQELPSDPLHHANRISPPAPPPADTYHAQYELPAAPRNVDRNSPPALAMDPYQHQTEHQFTHEAPSMPAIHVSDEKQALNEGSDYGDAVKVHPPSDHHHHSDPQYYDPHEEYGYAGHSDTVDIADDYHNGGLSAADLGYDVRRISMSFRPLPPDDPTDDPEQRANRIRSFYKEYFDESKPNPAGGDEYYEDYGAEYLGDAAFFDEETGQFIVANAPYAEPVTRRAMTPPPRAPPRFRGGPGHGPSMSYGQAMPRGPRAFSSQSGRIGPGGPGPRRPGPRKPMPPPAPLRELPTPHMLKDDLFLPIDFAPPQSVRDRVAGRPQTPTGGLRPYTPNLPKHMPLASSFDDLAVMPSPHALRKSGTFTGLDFAPPQPRFREGATGSDSGSIRSNRSGVSATHAYNIRTGAYRISRLPKETVGTKQDLMTELKPSWGMRAGS